MEKIHPRQRYRPNYYRAPYRTSITLGIAVIDSSHTSICWHSEKKRVQAQQNGYIQGNLPAFSKAVVLRRKISMMILLVSIWGHTRLATQGCFNLYAHILDCTLHFLHYSNTFSITHDVLLFSLPLFHSFGHGYEGLNFILFFHFWALLGTGIHVQGPVWMECTIMIICRVFTTNFFSRLRRRGLQKKKY